MNEGGIMADCVGLTVVRARVECDGALGSLEFSDGSGVAFNWPQRWLSAIGAARVSDAIDVFRRTVPKRRKAVKVYRKLDKYDLRPCPFCGCDEPVDMRGQQDGKGSGRRYWVRCPRCGGASGAERLKRGAFLSWNAAGECFWSPDGGNTLKTSCGNYFQTMDEGDKYPDFPYCPWCKGKIKEIGGGDYGTD